MTRRRLLVAVAVLALAAGAALLWRRAATGPTPLVASGALEAREIQVGSRAAGRVAEVFVREGQRLEPGQPILAFEPWDVHARRDEARAALARAEARLAEAVAGPRVEDIAEARAAVRAAEQELALLRAGSRDEEIAEARAAAEAAQAEAQNAATTAARYESLFREGVVSRQQVDDARSRARQATEQAQAARERWRLREAGSRPQAIEAAGARLAETRARLTRLERGTRTEEVAQARADVAAARARLAAEEVSVRELTVRAPADRATILEVFDMRPGELVRVGEPVATLVEPALEVRVFVPEPRLGEVAVGMPVSVSVASAGRIVPGVVTQVATQAEFTPRTIQTAEDRVYQVFAVKVRLDEAVSPTLRAGMAADVSFAQPPSGSEVASESPPREAGGSSRPIRDSGGGASTTGGASTSPTASGSRP